MYRYPHKPVSHKTTHPHSPRLFTILAPCQKNGQPVHSLYALSGFLAPAHTPHLPVVLLPLHHFPCKFFPVEMGGSDVTTRSL